jgi:cytidine deaminase
LTDDVVRVLVEVAEHTRSNAYAPYSGYRVGAAVLTGTDLVFGGCNVENASLGLTLCAERAAIAKALSDGERDFRAIVVVTEDGASPCGACRQVLAEFNPNLTVYLATPDGKCRVTNVSSLLPDTFVLPG